MRRGDHLFIGFVKLALLALCDAAWHSAGRGGHCYDLRRCDRSA